MAKRLTPDQQTLYQSIGKILLNDWDPIGVADCSQAKDEYDSYLPQVFRRILDDVSEEAITEYLLSVERDSMGLPGNKENCRKTVRLMFQEKERLKG